jgi:uncharacterized protein
MVYGLGATVSRMMLTREEHRLWKGAHVPVDPELIELLVCPACHGDIQYKDRRNLIICTKCGLQYPVRDNIPIMLIDEANKPAQRGGK